MVQYKTNRSHHGYEEEESMGKRGEEGSQTGWIHLKVEGLK